MRHDASCHRCLQKHRIARGLRCLLVCHAIQPGLALNAGAGGSVTGPSGDLGTAQHAGGALCPTGVQLRSSGHGATGRALAAE